MCPRTMSIIGSILVTSPDGCAMDYAKTYSQMADDELLRLASELESLVPRARTALALELYKRRVSIPDSVAYPTDAVTAKDDRQPCVGEDIPFPETARTRVTQTWVSSLGPYVLGANIGGLSGITEISPLEYTLLPKSFSDERILKAPDVGFLGHTWNVLLGVRGNRIYKISAQILTSDSREVRQAFNHSYVYFLGLMGEDQLERSASKFTWQLHDGNVILEKRGGVLQCVQFFITSSEVYEFPVAVSHSKFNLPMVILRFLISLPIPAALLCMQTGWGLSGEGRHIVRQYRLRWWRWVTGQDHFNGF